MTIAKAERPAEEASVAEETRRGRGRPQQRSDEETRAIVLEAARYEFSHTGYAATGMEGVARRAGVSTKTLYRLFPNKAALFEGMVAYRMESFLATVNLNDIEHEDIAHALHAALMACADLVLDDEVVALNRMMLAESERFPEIAETFYKTAMLRTIATLAGWLRRRQQRGQIRLDDAEEAAGMLLGMFVFVPQRAAIYGHQPLPSRPAIEARARACATLFLQGCGI